MDKPASLPRAGLRVEQDPRPSSPEPGPALQLTWVHLQQAGHPAAGVGGTGRAVRPDLFPAHRVARCPLGFVEGEGCANQAASGFMSCTGRQRTGTFRMFVCLRCRPWRRGSPGPSCGQLPPSGRLSALTCVAAEPGSATSPESTCPADLVPSRWHHRRPSGTLTHAPVASDIACSYPDDRAFTSPGLLTRNLNFCFIF